GRSLPRVAVDARIRICGRELVLADPLLLLVEERQLRSIVDPGVAAGCLRALAQVLAHLFFGLVVDVADIVDVRTLRAPLPVELARHPFERALSAAVISHQDDVPEPCGDRAQRNLAGDCAERGVRDGYGAGEPHVTGFPACVA